MTKDKEDKENLVVENSNTLRNSLNYTQSGKPRQKINNTTLKYISNNNEIEVQPSEIIFNNIYVNQSYEMTAYVRNLTKKSRRIRVFQPKSNKFRCDYEMQGNIAAGLAMKLVITFDCTSNIEQHDNIKVVSDNGFELEVPIHAYPQQAQILFEPFINFGFVRVNQTKKQSIYFMNEGDSKGEIELSIQAYLQEIVISPNKFIIGAKERKEVFVSYTSKDSGIFRGNINIKTNSQLFQNYIEVNATSVEYNRFLIDQNGDQITVLDFDYMYYGQQKEIETLLVNNTPKKYRFDINIRMGVQATQGNSINLQTPNELGYEQTEKIMSCYPNKGMIESYSQVPIVFKCKSRIKEINRQWSKQFSLNKDKSDKDDNPEEFNYSAIIDYQGDEDNTVLLLQGKGIHPKVKVNKSNLQFGECPMNEQRDILIQLDNRDMKLPIDFAFEKNSYFYMTPQNNVLSPDENQNVIVSFRPRNLGKFTNELQLLMNNGNYSIPIKLYGTSSTIQQIHNQTIRGIECLPINFSQDRNYIEDENFILYQRKKKNKKDNQHQHQTHNEIQSQMHEETISTIVKQDNNNLTMSLNNSQSIQDQHQQVHNSTMDRIKYFDYVRQQRQQRAQNVKKQKYQQKMQQLNDRMKEIEINQEKTGSSLMNNAKSSKTKEKTDKKDPPMDLEFILHDGPRIDSPRLKLPEQKDNLYVDRHIDRYEPTIIMEEKQFTHNSNQQLKKQFHSEPRTHIEIRDCQMELTGDKLQKIRISPQTVDFGTLFVKSTVKKTWAIKNDLRENIYVRLVSSNQELQETSQIGQVIPSGQIGMFEIVLRSQTVQNFIGYMKYIINEQHSFHYRIQAEVEPVKLSLDKLNVKFSFNDDSHEMETSEKLMISNNGNSCGKFVIKQIEGSVFIIDQMQGTVESKESKTINITYCPNKNSGGKVEEEKLILKTEDGHDQVIRCQGIVSESKCEFKERSIEFKDVCVCSKMKNQLTLKNSHKYPTAFVIETEDFPQIIEIQPVKGRLGPEETKIVNIVFQSNIEKVIKQEIVCKIRGGKSISVPVSANVQLPKLQIQEQSFDFGGIVTLGTPGKLPLTLKNDSNIGASLIVDLRENFDDQGDYEGVECLDMILSKELNQDDIDTIEKLEDDQEESLDQNEDLDKQSEDSSIDLDDQQGQQIPKYFKINIKPHKQLRFDLIFTPREVQDYNFLLPIYIQGWEQDIPQLQRQINAIGLKPSLLMEPHEIEFKKKIITTADKLYANKQSILLSNPDNEPIRFKFDTNILNSDKIFQLIPPNGVIEPNQDFNIEVSFNPYQPGDFEKKVNLFINDQQRPYLNLLLKGKGAYPRLVFDRKEVVLPLVPCNVQSKCTLRIINDGYENLNLNCITQEIQGSKLEISYPDGKNIGVTKSRVRIEVSFISKKPLTFCTNLEFQDDSSRVYTIPVSGVADNSLISNNIYMQRCPDEYQIKAEHGKTIQLIEDYSDQLSNPDNNHQQQPLNNKQNQSLKTGSVVSRQSSIFLGFNPINNTIIQQNIERTTNWLNYTALNTNIQSFPQDIINSNGQQIYELLQYLNGKIPVKQAQISIHMKREDKVHLLVQQYNELLKYLTEYGACLSTLKPHYLLNYQDITYYLKTLQDENTAFSALKVNESKFQYLSNTVWLHLFYQMIKIYYTSRITIKQFKLIFPSNITNITIPDYYMEFSNVYNQNEILLIRWMELNYEQQYPLNPRRISNFSTDLQDSIVFQSILKNYLQSSNIDNILVLKNHIYGDEDIKFNADKILQCLKEIGIQSYLKANDFVNINQVDMLLFCTQLYFQLPNYIPKSSSIIFQCILHETVYKYIELNNPTNKPISYWIKVEGDSEFEIEDQYVRLDPKQVQKIKVKFTSKISQKKYGRITFTNKKENNSQAAALVFNLESEIPIRKTEKVFVATAQLYECVPINIPIKNVFNNPNYEYANFKVSIMQEPTQEQLNKEKQQKQQKQNKKKDKKTNNSNQIGDNDDSNIQSNQISNLIPTFFCPREYVKVRKGDTYQLVIQYMPMSLEKHKAKLIFCDENFGEFQYEIHGDTLMPESLNEIKPNQGIIVDTPILYDYPISFKNDQIQKCKQIHEQRLISSSKFDEREKFIKHKFNSNEPLNFDIEIYPQTPFIQIPHSLSLVQAAYNRSKQQNSKSEKENPDKQDKNDKSNKKKQQKQQQKQGTEESTQENQKNNKLPINIYFKNPIQTTAFTITLKNKEKTDIRIYKLIFSVSPKAIKGNMEMKCPAGEELKQEIPIVNNSDKDWTIKIQLAGDYSKNAYLFNCPKDLSVKKKSQNSFNISFKPSQICQAEAKLIIQNQQTNDYFEYDIIGIGEEPLAVEHFVLNCQAKKSTITYIDIKNQTDKQITYQVETDLLNVEGDNQFSLQPNQNSKYPLKITPQIGGLYTGQITFYEKGNRNKFFWYTVCVNTERPRQEKTIELISQIRKGVAFDVKLNNPLDEPVTFEVQIVGDDLQGEEMFMLMPKQQGIYELIFSPLKVFRGKGNVSFMNEKLGEIWYDLNLISEDVGFQRLPTLKAELGKYEETTVSLENPSKYEVKVQPVISNMQNFSVCPDDIVIYPYSNTNVSIKYTPSELESNETGEIRFMTEEIGQWKYQIFGCGLPPTQFEARNIYSALMNDVSEIVVFRNPFKDSIQVSIQLITQDQKSQEAFQLLSKKRDKITVPGLSPFQIPFSFCPKQMNEFYCEIYVSMNEKINWRFPLKGITECLSKQMNLQFKTKARVPFETQLRLQLPGLPLLDQKEQFEHQIANLDNNEFSQLIQRSFTISPVKKTLSGPGDHLLYNIKFQPMRPFKSSIDLIITRQLGGRWIFKLNLESSEPDEDDTIIIYSPLNRTSSVSFKLQNRYKTFSSFQAFFLPDSDPEFNIMPKTGELEPLGREGKTFIVSFTPIEYGKQKKGKLVIETDELYWSFVVKGTFPQYKPPNVNRSLIDHQMDLTSFKKDQELDKKKKNYLIDNMKKKQNSPNQKNLKTANSQHKH